MKALLQSPICIQYICMCISKGVESWELLVFFSIPKSIVQIQMWWKMNCVLVSIAIKTNFKLYINVHSVFAILDLKSFEIGSSALIFAIGSSQSLYFSNGSTDTIGKLYKCIYVSRYYLHINRFWVFVCVCTIFINLKMLNGSLATLILATKQ